MLSAQLNMNRRMGAEFEMTIPLVGSGNGTDIQQILANVLTANGVPAIHRGYSNAILPTNIDVAVECDSSIRGESHWQGIRWFPIEIKTRILAGVADWEAVVPRTLAIASYLGARVNNSCGHHLHIEVPEIPDRPKVIRSLHTLHFKFQEVIYGLVAPSRRQNGYAQPINFNHRLLQCRSLRSFQSQLRSSTTKHQALNLTHIFSGDNRVEYRWHGGTLDPVKSRHWMYFCNRMVEHSVTRNCQASTALPNDRKSLQRLLISCGFLVNRGIYANVAPELRETGKYMLQRWKHFNGNVALKSKTSEEVA